MKELYQAIHYLLQAKEAQKGPGTVSLYIEDLEKEAREKGIDL